jgi:hypothetical protein
MDPRLLTLAAFARDLAIVLAAIVYAIDTL